MNSFLMRNPAFVMLARGGSYYVLRAGRPPLAIPHADVELLSRVMQMAAAPTAQARIDELLGEKLRTLLVEQKALLRGSENELQQLAPALEKKGKPACKRLVIGLTGAIAALQLTPLLPGLLDSFAERIDVILTESALQLVNPRAFAFLGVRAWSDAFAAGENVRVPHIHLAQAAELVAVAPASAHTLHKVAQGACSDLLSLTIAATAAPVVLVPAMNRAMWNNPSIVRNLRQLRDDGYYVIEPGMGREIAQQGEEALGYGVMGLGPLGLAQVLREIFALHRRQ